MVFHNLVQTNIVEPISGFAAIVRELMRGIPQATQLAVILVLCAIVILRAVLDPPKLKDAGPLAAGPGHQRVPRLGEWRYHLSQMSVSETSAYAVSSDLRKIVLRSIAGDDTQDHATVIEAARAGKLDAPAAVCELLTGEASWIRPGGLGLETFVHSRFPKLRGTVAIVRSLRNKRATHGSHETIDAIVRFVEFKLPGASSNPAPPEQESSRYEHRPI